MSEEEFGFKNFILEETFKNETPETPKKRTLKPNRQINVCKYNIE